MYKKISNKINCKYLNKKIFFLLGFENLFIRFKTDIAYSSKIKYILFACILPKHKTQDIFLYYFLYLFQCPGRRCLNSAFSCF